MIRRMEEISGQDERPFKWVIENPQWTATALVFAAVVIRILAVSRGNTTTALAICVAVL